MSTPATTVRYPRRQSRAITGGVLWTLLFPILFASIGKIVGMILHMAPGPPGWLGPALVGGVGVGVAAAALAYRAARAKPGSIRREGDRVVVERDGRRREILLGAIDSGWISKESTQLDRLGLSLLDGETVDVTLPTGTGAATLEALGLDAKRRRLRISSWQAADNVLMGFAGAALGGLAWLPVLGVAGDVVGKEAMSSPVGVAVVLGTLLPMMVGGAALLRRTKPEITIGSDGVRVTGGSLRKNERFYPIDRVVGTRSILAGPKRGTTQPMLLQLELRKGANGLEREVVPLASYASGAGKAPPFVAVVEERIREAMTARDASSPAEASALLDVPSDGVTAWLTTLKRLAQAADVYRAATLTEDRLLELVADARAKVAHRIGAAVVLAERGDPRGLERVRLAADASASPRVRLALETVANQDLDEQAIAEALADEAAEAEEAARAASS